MNLVSWALWVIKFSPPCPSSLLSRHLAPIVIFKQSLSVPQESLGTTITRRTEGEKCAQKNTGLFGLFLNKTKAKALSREKPKWHHTIRIDLAQRRMVWEKRRKKSEAIIIGLAFLLWPDTLEGDSRKKSVRSNSKLRLVTTFSESWQKMPHVLIWWINKKKKKGKSLPQLPCLSW